MTKVQGEIQMDDLLLWYPMLMVAGVLFNIAFWGTVIYFAVKMFGGADTRTPQLLNMVLAQRGGFSGHSGSYEPGPVESQMNQMVAENGIDLNR
jgi:hypothetical protein